MSKYNLIADAIEAHAASLPNAPDWRPTFGDPGERVTVEHGALTLRFPGTRQCAESIAAKYRKGYRRPNNGGRGALNQREIIERAQRYVNHVLTSGTNSLTFWPWWPKGTNRSLYTWQQVVLELVLGHDLTRAEPSRVEALEHEATAAGWTIRYADPEEYKLSDADKATAKAA